MTATSTMRLAVPLLAMSVLGAAEPVAARAPQEAERGVRLADDGTVDAPSSDYGRRHALVIGIDDYQAPGYPDLGFAVKDARGIARVLVDRFGFDPADVRLLLNEEATKAALDTALEEWACDGTRIGEDDLLVIFFAGHGVTRTLGKRGSRGYLVPIDGDQDERGEPAWGSLVGMNDLEDISEAVPAKHVLFLLDCCFGGLAVSRSAPPVAAGLSSRARQVISAGSATQTVLDTGGGGHSVFTGELIRGMEGAADRDDDGVITFGELFNHVGAEVERKTDQRQTPLQAAFADHEGGSVALFAPGVRPARMSTSARLAALERTNEEQLREMKRLSGAILASDLKESVDELWPRRAALVPRYRDWLNQARSLIEDLPLHEESIRLVRDEALLRQIEAGQPPADTTDEPAWEIVDPALRWKHAVFSEFVADLRDLQALAVDVEARLELALEIERWTVEQHRDAWDEVLADVAADPAYRGWPLEPQVGFVPLGKDPQSGLWEFAYYESGTVPERDSSTGALRLTEDSGLVFVLIPGGSFVMGSQSWDAALPNYDPHAERGLDPHPVRLDPFLISKYEMTQGVWTRLMGRNPSLYPPGPAARLRMGSYNWPEVTLLHPVEQLSWLDCTDAVRRLGLVLPTEAQWELAARGGTETPWTTGTERASLQGFANIADAFLLAEGNVPNTFADYYERWNDGFAAHSPVGHWQANPFGLHDVHGNVSEWCRDRYGNYQFPLTEGDGERIVQGEENRVLRGGAYDENADGQRTASRFAFSPDTQSYRLGLRPAKALE